jgi:hypothetical protein
MIIKKVLIKKYSFYYEFKNVLRDSSIVALSFLIQFTQLDSEILEDTTEGTKDEEIAFEIIHDLNDETND